MRNLIKTYPYKLYDRLIMSTNETRSRTFAIKILEYLLLPKFLRVKQLYIIKKIGVGLEIMMIVIFLSMGIKVVLMDGRLNVSNVKFWLVKSQNERLLDNARAEVYTDIKDSFENSGGYIRYRLFVDDNIKVPERMSNEHLAIAVLEARKNNVPLSILFNIIKHESDFDSVAKNPASSAYSYMQVISPTFNSFYKQLGLTGGKTPGNIIKVGIARLRYGFDYWKKHCNDNEQCWRFAIACFAIGDSAPRAISGIPDTVRPYVDFAMKDYKN